MKRFVAILAISALSVVETAEAKQPPEQLGSDRLSVQLKSPALSGMQRECMKNDLENRTHLPAIVALTFCEPLRLPESEPDRTDVHLKAVPK